MPFCAWSANAAKSALANHLFSTTRHNGGMYLALLTSAAAVLAVDQTTKEIALGTLDDGPVDLIEGVLTFRLTFNSGGAFGLGRDFPGVFLAATVIIILFILVAARRMEDRSWAVPLGLVLGGGLGNVADRVFRGEGGHVVDFIDLHFWPVFNVADSAIVVAVGIMLVLGAKAGREPEPET